jgi:hypothetical protein
LITALMSAKSLLNNWLNFNKLSLPEQRAVPSGPIKKRRMEMEDKLLRVIAEQAYEIIELKKQVQRANVDGDIWYRKWKELQEAQKELQEAKNDNNQ